MKINKFLEGCGFIFRDLIQDGWRSVLTVANLTVFIGCFFCLTALSEAGIKFGSQPVDQTTLMVISHEVFDPNDSQITDAEFAPIQELIPMQVKSVSPLILRHLNIEGYLLQLRATYLEEFQSVHSLSLLQGAWPARAHEVVIGEGTVSLTHWKVAQVIRIYGVDFTISGIVRAPGTKFGSVWMTLENAENLFGTHGVYQFAWVVLTSGADGEAVRTRLQSDPRISKKFDVYFVDQLYQQYSKALSDISGISSMLNFLALSCVMLGVYGSTYLTLNERDRDLTILRAVGFDSIKIRLILSLRTLVQVTASYLLGWLIAFFSIQYFERLSPLMIHSIPLPVIISGRALIIGYALCLIFAWIGVWLPTSHLRKTSVAAMIHR